MRGTQLVEKRMSPENDPISMRRALKRAGIAGAGLLAAVLLFGLYTRFVEASDLKNWTSEEEIPTVALITPIANGKTPALVLPGSLQAFYDAQIYSRVPGYVHAWYKDIG